jgi:hypothetical protein
MNKIKLIAILFLFSVSGFSQTDTSKIAPPPSKPDSLRNPQQSPNNNYNQPGNPGNKKRPKSFTDYEKGKRLEDKKPFSDYLYYGANLQFGYYGVSGGSALSYDVSPHVGLKFTDMVSAGVQLIYKNTIYTIGSTQINYNIVGGGVFGRLLFGGRYFIHGELDALSIPAGYLGNAISKRQPCDEKMVGLGYKSLLGSKLSYFFMILFDINPEIYSPYYGNQIVPRGGVVYNF